MPFCGAPLLYMAIVNQDIQRLRNNVPEIIFAVFLFGTSAIVLWEVFEFVFDPFSPIVWQPGNQDTMLDLIAGCIGSIGGGIFLALRRRDFLD